MSDAYVGVNGVARKTKALYVGVDGVARQVKAGYVGVDGVARKIFSASAAHTFAFTAAYSASQVTVDGVLCNLYTLTTSGTLTVGGTSTRVWLCGGGAGGGNGQLDVSSSPTYLQRSYGGPGGGGGYTQTGLLEEGSYAVTIGSGGSTYWSNGSTTTVGAFSAAGGKTPSLKTHLGGEGGSGGGCGATNSNSLTTVTQGAGVSTCPFGLTSLREHCAGGGGGGYRYYNNANASAKGGAGGTNGSSGGAMTYPKSGDHTGGAGGAYGGGTGGSLTGEAGSSCSYINATAATFYGGGGGGGAVYHHSEVGFSTQGNAGYQGVVYVLQPA